VMDTNVGTGKTTWYEVPPCRASQDYDPLRPIPTPEQAKKSNRPVPPLSKQEQAQSAREVKETPKYTEEEEKTLAAARRILMEKSVEVTAAGTVPKAKAPPPPLPKSSAAASAGLERPIPVKRPQEAETDGMIYVEERDILLMRQIEELEHATNTLKLELAEREYARHQRPPR